MRNPGAIAAEVVRLLDNPARRRKQMVADFDDVIAKLGKGGANENAARAILKELPGPMKSDRDVEERISSLHADRLIDLHFDLPLSLFLSRPRRNIVATGFPAGI